MSNKRRTLSPDSPCAVLAAVLLFLSAGLLLVHLAWTFRDTTLQRALFIDLLPGACCVLLGTAFLSRKNSLVPTIVPLLLGLVVFALRPMGLPRWQNILVCVLSGIFALIYILTVTGVLSSRHWLLSFCAVPFLFHFFSDLGHFRGFGAFLPELAALLPMAALFFVGWGMRRGRLYN